MIFNELNGLLLLAYLNSKQLKCKTFAPFVVRNIHMAFQNTKKAHQNDNIG